MKGASSDPFTNKNPSYQIAFYIQHSGLAWGILTNGRLWRLYHKDTAHKLDHYYEVDLPALLKSGDSRQFLYFYAFFHRSAFDAHPLGVAAILLTLEGLLPTASLQKLGRLWTPMTPTNNDATENGLAAKKQEEATAMLGSLGPNSLIFRNIWVYSMKSSGSGYSSGVWAAPSKICLPWSRSTGNSNRL